MKSDPINATIFLVDDDPSVLKAISRLLLSAGLNVAAFQSAGEFLIQCNDSLVGCIVLDVAMPNTTGPELQNLLNQSTCHLPIIFLTGDGNLPTGIKAMKSGAFDFLTKPCPDEVLLDAIQQALAADRARQAKQFENQSIEDLFATLTPREHQVMLGVVAGSLNKAIAKHLGTAEKTIKVHRARVMSKLRVDSVADLVRLAERAGIRHKQPSMPVNRL